MKLIVTYLVLVVLFTGSLFLSTLIPSSPIRSHISQSLPLLIREGQYPTIDLPWRSIVLDNYTDALILNTIFTLDTRDVSSPLKGVRTIKQASELNQISNLQSVIDGSKQTVQYERYWHGYLLPLRAALTLMPYEMLRVLMMSLLLLLSCTYVWLAYRKWGVRRTLAICIALASTDFLYAGLSLQFAPVFIIGFMGGIYLLQQNHHKSNLPNLFFILGGVTAYMDLLTAPLITLSLVLAVSDIDDLKKMMRMIVAWGGGYALLWATKWILAELFLGPGPLTAAYEQIRLRTSASEGFEHLQLQAVMLNVKQLIGYHKVSKLIAMGSVLIPSLLLLRFHKKGSISRIPLARILLLILPYLWYMFAANHSVMHVWFTYRAQFLAIFILSLTMLEMIDVSRIMRAVAIYRKIVASKPHKPTSKNQ